MENNLKERYNKIPQSWAMAIMSSLRKKGERHLPSTLDIIKVYEKINKRGK